MPGVPSLLISFTVSLSLFFSVKQSIAGNKNGGRKLCNYKAICYEKTLNCILVINCQINCSHLAEIEMDKFVVRKPRVPRQDVRKDCPVAKLKQATIESLPNVVVVENIYHLKTQLENENSTDNEILTALKELSAKIVSKEVLLKTKIGCVVNSLRKHDNDKIKAMAKVVFRKWKHVEVEEAIRPVIEVQCDKKTEAMRKKARTFLADSLKLLGADPLPEQIERAVFLEFGRRIDNNYKRKMRSIVFTLKHKDSVRKKVTEHKLKVEDLIRNRPDQLL